MLIDQPYYREKLQRNIDAYKEERKRFVMDEMPRDHPIPQEFVEWIQKGRKANGIEY